MTERVFAAPFGKHLIVLGTFAVVIAIGLLFMIRGYRVYGAELVVLRPIGNARISLEGVRSVEVVPFALAGSLRSFGIGGFFSNQGRFHSPRLGAIRAYVSDDERTVVMRLSDDTTLVVSPDDPAAFAAAVEVGT